MLDFVKPGKPTGDKNNKQQQQQQLPPLPDDVVLEILLRLPVKSLCQFRCVSKSWYNLSSDPQFAKLHMKQSIKANRLTYVLYSEEGCHSRLELDYEGLVKGDVAKKTESDDSLFGLEIELDQWRYGVVVMVCFALLLRGYSCLGKSIRQRTKFIGCVRKQIFMPCIVGGGFGYDAVNDDYKVLKVDSRRRTADIYSLKDDSWSRQRGLPDHKRTNIMGSASQCLNGAIHWLNYEFVDGKRHVGITSFGLAKEELFYLLTPIVEDDHQDEHKWWERGLYNLHEVGGCLCIIPDPSLSSTWNANLRCDFWVMETYGVKLECWKHIRLNFKFEQLIPLNFPNSEGSLFVMDGRLYLYNHRNGHRREVKHERAPELKRLNKAFSYVESLVSLGGTRMSEEHQRFFWKKEAKFYYSKSDGAVAACSIRELENGIRS